MMRRTEAHSRVSVFFVVIRPSCMLLSEEGEEKAAREKRSELLLVMQDRTAP